MKMPHVYHDGGRRAAMPDARTAGDCVARAIAIVSERPYTDVHAALSAGNASQRVTQRTPKRIAGLATADRGILTGRKWFKDYMGALGFTWTPTMRIGSGCTVHLAAGELPMGRLVVSVSRHYTAVIDGVIYDTHDPQREGSVTHWFHPDGRLAQTTRSGGRCVYGYWRLEMGRVG